MPYGRQSGQRTCGQAGTQRHRPLKSCFRWKRTLLAVGTGDQITRQVGHNLLVPSLRAWRSTAASSSGALGRSPCSVWSAWTSRSNFSVEVLARPWPQVCLLIARPPPQRTPSARARCRSRDRRVSCVRPPALLVLPPDVGAVVPVPHVQRTQAERLVDRRGGGPELGVTAPPVHPAPVAG